MGWLIALAVITGICVIPVGVSARYRASGPLIRLLLGPVKLQVYPQKKKSPSKPKQKKQEQKSQGGAPAPQTKEKGGKLTDFMPLVRTVLDFLSDFRRKLRVNRLEMQLTLGGEDPCDLGVHYGEAWAALSSLEPQLDRFFVIQKKDLQILYDFEDTQTRIVARLDLTITVGRLLYLVGRYGFRVLREFISIMKLRKGGAVK